MIPFLSVVSPRKDRLIEGMSRQKSKRERNIQAFVRSEAHQITRKGYEGWRFLFITFAFIHSKFCSLYCTGLSIEKTPTSSPGRCFDSLALEKTQEALKGSLGRGVPAKPSSPETLFKTKIVGSTKWTAHCQPSTHFLDTQCKTFTLKTIQLLCVQRLHFRGISYFSFSHASSCHEKGALLTG